MVKVDVISGFLGAGKTTLIKKLFTSKMGKEKIALIENEFGEIGIDSTFLKDSGIEIKEINSGCICCSLVGNFEKSLRELIDTYNPERIIIEPSGVGKLSDILNAIKSAGDDLKINVVCTVVDGGKCKMYLKNFGEFYIDQIREANTIVLSKTDKITEDKIITACETIKTYNPTVTIITTPIDKLDGEFLLENLEDNVSLVDMLINQLKNSNEHHHHHHHDHDDDCDCGHHHHDHDDDCDCGHHHHDHDDDCDCGHHHHDHDDDCDCGHHHHDHDDDCDCGHHHHHEDDCDCGHHHHDHEDGKCCCGHHHHHAEEVFDSWGIETPISYTKDEINAIMQQLATEKYGIILRSKGVVKAKDGDNWYHFDFVAGDYEVREGSADVIGKLCVIGSKIDKEEIQKLFLKKV